MPLQTEVVQMVPWIEGAIACFEGKDSCPNNDENVEDPDSSNVCDVTPPILAFIFVFPALINLLISISFSFFILIK